MRHALIERVTVTMPRGRRKQASTVVRPAARRGMLKEKVRRTCERLATAKGACLPCVQCVKGEYAVRIKETLSGE